MIIGRYIFLISLICCALVTPVRGADAPYVPTPWNVVEAMLKLGEVGATDYLIDLGSGDGRIVITAAKRLGTRGFGIDLDDNLVRTARREAKRQGVIDRVSFLTENLFHTDISRATVITMYMGESVNLRLRPELFKLKPGTRIVSHDFDMAKWLPDEKLTVAVPDKPYGAPSSEIFLWIVPADASGRWRWQSMLGGKILEQEATFDQTFQMLSGTVSVSGKRVVVRNARVRGETVSFTILTEREGNVTSQDFNGRLSGDVLEGRVIADGVQTPWRAIRVSRGRMNIETLVDSDKLRFEKRGD